MHRALLLAALTGCSFHSHATGGGGIGATTEPNKVAPPPS